MAHSLTDISLVMRSDNLRLISVIRLIPIIGSPDEAIDVQDGGGRIEVIILSSTSGGNPISYATNLIFSYALIYSSGGGGGSIVVGISSPILY